MQIHSDLQGAALKQPGMALQTVGYLLGQGLFHFRDGVTRQYLEGGELTILCVKEAADKRCSEGLQRRWAGLDGQLYFPTALENPRLFYDQTAARQVLHQLQHLRRSAGLQSLPSPYYAILLMDGDQLGKHMGEQAKQQPISAALNQFITRQSRVLPPEPTAGPQAAFGF